MSYNSTAAVPRDVASENAFAELRQQIKEAGLLDRQLSYYTLKIAFTLSLVAISISLFFVIGNFWVLLAVNAPFMAFALGQVGFISHDSGHRQIFTRVRGNEIIALTCSFLMGLSRTWWIEKHNRHHRNPNQLDMDPDIEIAVLAFSEEQALAKSGIFRSIVKRQAQLFLPVLFFQAYALRLASIQYMLKNRIRYPVLEPLSMLIHPAVYLGVLFYFLNPWQAVVFLLVNQALLGVYLASVFAPNHKGMLVLDKNTGLDFLRRQVLTARNVKGHPLVDFWYGGLNYQIEHHLFPRMPRNNLGKAQRLVKRFCAERGIRYHEVGMLRSYQEIIEFLHHVSAPLRRRAAGTSA
jgi:fatty acid desaturase